ncbi:MAG TPA: ABC transporter permease [Alphaproteobacteria bacterium]
MAPEQVTVIQPSRAWSLPDPRLIWRFRDLLILLIRRDFTVRYRQTLLGPIWMLLQPLALTGMFTLIFKLFASLPTEGRPAVLFYFSGLIGWSYASLIVGSVAGTFINNAFLFSRVWFPRLVMPLATVCSGLFAVALQLALLAVLLIVTGEPGPGWRILALPLAVVLIAMLSLAGGLLIASSTAKYRDLSVATPFLIQLWLFATPIIYPLASVPEGWRTALALLNPLAPLVELLRWSLIGSGTVEPLWIAAAAIETLILLLVAAVLFQRVERTVVDTV